MTARVSPCRGNFSSAQQKSMPNVSAIPMGAFALHFQPSGYRAGHRTNRSKSHSSQVLQKYPWPMLSKIQVRTNQQPLALSGAVNVLHSVLVDALAGMSRLIEPVIVRSIPLGKTDCEATRFA